MQEIISKKDIGGRIKSLRTDKGFSQEQFAETIHLSRSNYSQIELGNQFPTYEVLLKISRYYGKSYEWILHGKDGIFSNMKFPKEAAEVNYISKLLQLSEHLGGCITKFESTIQELQNEITKLKETQNKQSV
ncbi:MAG TPA: helix-turn-helix transcriptional regulator [Flavipsychrobacter sp.]|nr:helix-turn-helix transcriptional regulator [Flavipsychrobacter sp.]